MWSVVSFILFVKKSWENFSAVIVHTEFLISINWSLIHQARLLEFVLVQGIPYDMKPVQVDHKCITLSFEIQSEKVEKIDQKNFISRKMRSSKNLIFYFYFMSLFSTEIDPPGPVQWVVIVFTRGSAHPWLKKNRNHGWGLVGRQSRNTCKWHLWKCMCGHLIHLKWNYSEILTFILAFVVNFF